MPVTLTVPALNLNKLLKGLPAGHWVAITADHSGVVAHGADLDRVIAQSKKRGETNPLIVRVPKHTTALLL